MGGCVTSYMKRQNDASQVPHEWINHFRQYGYLASKVGEADDEFSAIYRKAGISDEQFEKDKKEFYWGPNCLERLQNRSLLTPEALAIRYRTVEKVQKETITDEKGNSKEWDITYLHDTQSLTLRQLWEHVENFGKGLLDLGLKSGDRLAIYEDTRWEWLVSCYGAWSQNLVCVTVYANLGEFALSYALKEADVSAIVCNGKNVSKLAALLQHHKLSHITILYVDDLQVHEALPSAVTDYTIIPWEQVITLGSFTKHPASFPTRNDEPALIMYTSGTTGDPKGVVLDHGAISSGVHAFTHHLYEQLHACEANETYLAYLPLAHIMEFCIESVMLLRGTILCYGSPRTLTDNMARPYGDLKEYQPHILVGVPRVFDTIKKAVESKLPPVGTLKRTIFDTAYADRLQCLEKGIETPYWNKKIFGKPREVFGGNLRLLVVGGAPLSAVTHEFLNVVVGTRILTGYGLTETCAVVTTQHAGDPETGVVGTVMRGVEVKLRGVEGWRHTGDEPCGEICIRSPGLALEYFQQPNLTDEFFVDGWLRTGDIGHITRSGNLAVIGRIKALAKNVLGEYIALEHLEAIYGANPLAIANGVCVLVHPHRAAITALVLTDEEKTMEFAQQQNVPGDYASVLANPEFHRLAAQSLASTGKRAGLKPFELLKYVRMLGDQWTAENDMLTAAMKLKRRMIDIKYKDLIAELFSVE